MRAVRVFQDGYVTLFHPVVTRSDSNGWALIGVTLLSIGSPPPEVLDRLYPFLVGWKARPSLVADLLERNDTLPTLLSGTLLDALLEEAERLFVSKISTVPKAS
ncbi:hypothetical protein PM082_004602 [Marasmius tenuissimus]|nr:hypothetical protein PM082_004602 [Marasmius tenuissimus]